MDFMFDLNNQKQKSSINLLILNFYTLETVFSTKSTKLIPQIYMKSLLPSARLGQMMLWREWPTSSWSRLSLETTRGKRPPTLSSTSIRARFGYQSGTCQSWAAITMSHPPRTWSWSTPSKTCYLQNRRRQWRPRGDM